MGHSEFKTLSTFMEFMLWNVIETQILVGLRNLLHIFSSTQPFPKFRKNLEKYMRLRGR